MSMNRKQRRLQKKAPKNTLASTDPAQAILQQAILSQSGGDNYNARKLYQQVLEVRPGCFEALNNLGIICLQNSEYEQAKLLLAKAFEIKPEEASTHRSLALALGNNGDFHEALVILEKYRRKNPRDILTDAVYTSCLLETRQFKKAASEAKTLLNRSEKEDERRIADLFQVLVKSLIAEKKYPEALQEAEIAEKQYSDNNLLLPHLAFVYQSNHLINKASEITEKLYRLYPDDPGAIANYAVAKVSQGKTGEALVLIDRALSLNNRLSKAYVTKTSILRNYLGKIDQAIESARTAIELDPTNPHIHNMLGNLLIINENFAEGYAEYEWRWQYEDFFFSELLQKMKPFTRPWWGEDLNGKNLLLYADQGIGDVILHLRFVQKLSRIYSDLKLTILCEPKIKLFLVNNLPETVQFVHKEELASHNNNFEFISACGSLPLILEESIETVTTEAPYIKPCKPPCYRDNKDQIVIGISWFTTNPTEGIRRKINLADFSFLKDFGERVKIINLQYGDMSKEIEDCKERLGFRVHDDPEIDAYASIQDHVDQVAACDLVISIDNTTVHTAGALGKPVWVLLPFDPYYRWLKDHPNSPWYPTMRLFRQPEPGDWASVLVGVKEDLGKYIKERNEKILLPKPFKPSMRREKQKTAVLLNDTSTWYHWGCTGTSLAIRREIEKKGFLFLSVPHQLIAMTEYPAPTLGDFDNPAFLACYRLKNPTLFNSIKLADLVLINGEGTIHGTASNALRLMYLSYVAKTVFGKEVHIINHACFPEDSDRLTNPQILAFYLKAYRAVDFVAVRDPISHNLLNQMGIKNELAFDSLPLSVKAWREITKPSSDRSKRVLFAGSSKFSEQSDAAFANAVNSIRNKKLEPSILVGAKWHPAGDDRRFIEMMQRVCPEIEVVDAKSFEEWLETIASAKLLISGRFHYTIAAACLNTPFVALEGNTPKIAALCNILNRPAPLSYEDPKLLARLPSQTEALLNQPEQITYDSHTTETLCNMAARNFLAL